MFELTSTYLNAAYMGPTPLRAKQYVEDILKSTMDPSLTNFEARMRLLEEIRADFADLLNARADNVAISTSVSELVGHVVNGMDLEPGDNVIVMDGDYPSLVLPWMLAAENRGIRLIRLPLQKFLEPAQLREEIDDRTRLIACSHVMFNTGLRLPIEEIGKVAHEKNVMFLTDVSQSFGGSRIRREILDHVDILVCVGYKWLLGPYGSAFGYFNDRALKEIRRTHATWTVSVNSANTENLLNYTLETLPGARKFDRGETSSYLICAGLKGALEVIKERGLEKIETHNQALVHHFIEGLPKNFEVLAPPEFRSNIICVKPLSGDVQKLKQALLEQNIQISVREGAVRFSFHLYNTRTQIDDTLKCLRIRRGSLGRS
jgi:selenocysteine lyase/cysteine desulfurase